MAAVDGRREAMYRYVYTIVHVLYGVYARIECMLWIIFTQCVVVEAKPKIVFHLNWTVTAKSKNGGKIKCYSYSTKRHQEPNGIH